MGKITIALVEVDGNFDLNGCALRAVTLRCFFSVSNVVEMGEGLRPKTEIKTLVVWVPMLQGRALVRTRLRSSFFTLQARLS